MILAWYLIYLKIIKKVFKYLYNKSAKLNFAVKFKIFMHFYSCAV